MSLNVFGNYFLITILIVMKYGSLFSGIEAASLAFEPLGWEPQWFAEIDEFCCDVLKTRWPHVPNLGSVTDPDFFEKASKVDLIIGGSPCPSFSVAGKRKGMMDERGVLTFRYCEIIRKIHPKWFIWENVPGFLTSNNGEDFKVVINEMCNSGYGVSWRILDARCFGLPQSRRRLYVVGRLGVACPREILFDEEDGADTLEQHGCGTEDTASKDQTVDVIPFALRGRSTGYVIELMKHYGCLRATGGVGMGFVWDGVGLRRVTPLECERLMGMPDYHTDMEEAKDSLRWKSVGNSMAVPAVRWIGKRIKVYESSENLSI